MVGLGTKANTNRTQKGLTWRKSTPCSKAGSGSGRAGSGERGAGSGERGAGSGERGAGSGERGAGSGERGAGSGERGAGSGSGERGAGSGERGFRVRNRTFCEGDNLEFLLRMPDACIDLIVTDPPFKKDKKFQGIGAAEGAEFKDYWTWEEDAHLEYLEHVRKHWPALLEVIEAAYAAHSPSMAAFLAFMSVRLIEMHRVLKPTGSLYLHCDPTANAYMRLMLDSIFDRENFRNEIVWGYRGGGVPTDAFARKHDTMLFYVKGSGAVFNKQYVPYSEASQKLVGKRGGVSIDGKERDLARGASMPDWWVDINSLQTWSPERTGWPTQKPLALYRRMIAASTRKDDMVLDPFAGCATTCVAAEQLERQWIGIDLSPKARGITLDRLKKEAGEGTFWPNEVHTVVESDLPPLPKGIVAALSIPQLPERIQRRIPRGYKPEDVRPYLAAREGQGMQQKHAPWNIACQGCGYEPPRLDYQDVDHIIPQAKEGANAWNNFCLLCPPCNRRKAHKLTIEELRAAIAADHLVLDASKLMPMDEKAITKRDRKLRPLQ